jgi:hypothetical protein
MPRTGKKLKIISFAERKLAYVYAVNSAVCFFAAKFLIYLFLITVMNSSFIHYVVP